MCKEGSLNGWSDNVELVLMKFKFTKMFNLYV